MAEDEDKIVIEDGDFDKEGMDLGSLKLFGIIMGGLMDESAKMNNSMISIYQGQAERREKALEIALELLADIIPEVPRSSEGGLLLTRLYNLIVTALYHKEIDLETFRQRGRWE